MRDNFNPRARWKAAIAGARALHRFGSSNSRTSGSSKSSGGWKAIDSDADDDDDDEAIGHSQSPPAEDDADALTENEFVKVTGPEEDPPPAVSPRPSGAGPPADMVRSQDSAQSNRRPTSGHELKHEADAHKPLEQNVPKELHEVHEESHAPGNTRRHPYADSEESLRMPGSFNIPEHSGRHHHLNGWTDLFKKLHIKS